MKKLLFFFVVFLSIFTVLSCDKTVSTTTESIDSSNSTTVLPSEVDINYYIPETFHLKRSGKIEGFGEVYISADYRMFKLESFYNFYSFSYDDLAIEITWEDLGLNSLIDESESLTRIYELMNATLIKTDENHWFVYNQSNLNLSTMFPLEQWTSLESVALLNEGETILEVRLLDELMIVLTSSNRILVGGHMDSTVAINYSSFTDITSDFNLAPGETFLNVDESFNGNDSYAAFVFKTSAGQVFVFSRVIEYYQGIYSPIYPNLYVNINEISDKAYFDVINNGGILYFYNQTSLDYWILGEKHSYAISLEEGERLLINYDYNLFITDQKRIVELNGSSTEISSINGTTLSILYVASGDEGLYSRIFLTDTGYYYIYYGHEFVDITAAIQIRLNLGYIYQDYTFAHDEYTLFYDSSMNSFIVQPISALLLKTITVEYNSPFTVNDIYISGFYIDSWVNEPVSGVVTEELNLYPNQSFELSSISIQLYLNGELTNTYQFLYPIGETLTFDDIVTYLELQGGDFILYYEMRSEYDSFTMTYDNQEVSSFTVSSSPMSIQFYQVIVQ